MTVYAIYEADGQRVTMQAETAYALVSGGGQARTGISGCVGHIFYQATVGALQAVDYKGPNRQYAGAGKLIIELWN